MAIRSFTVLSLLVSAVLAQSTDPLIPSGISSGCTNYLNSLDNDEGFAPCTQPFTSALKAFSPGANASSPSSSDITSALNELCASSAFAACPQSLVTSQLSSFYAACEVELTSAPNVQVQTTYDVLYSLVPLKTALCSKDDSGNYCATKLPTSSGTGNVALVEDPGSSTAKSSDLSQYLYVNPGVARRDVSNSTTALVPNTTTYRDTNLVFMLLEPSLPSSELCVTCTRNIITPYITFESSCPYGPGLSNSLILAGQIPLYNNITSKCGASFLGGAVQAAGGLSGSIVSSNGGSRGATQDFSVAVSAIMGVAALMAASL